MKISKVLPALFLALLLALAASAPAADTLPKFTSAPIVSGVPLVGHTMTFWVTVSDPQGLPLTTTYNYGNGSIDMLGRQIYSAPGVYRVIVTASNGTASATAEVQVAIQDVANLWIKSQSIKGTVAGKQSWHATYIYNADRTLAHIFNPTTEDFVASLGSIPIIQIKGNGAGAQNFTGKKPKFLFKSDKGATPAISVLLDESAQTITVNGTLETFTDQVPGVFHNSVQLGTNGFSLDQAFDSEGTFAANSGYRSIAFVVSAATIGLKKAGKDSAVFSMLLGDPAFAFPSATGIKTVRVRVSNVLSQVVFDKDLTSSVTTKAGILKSAGGIFSYDSIKGKMAFKLSKASLSGPLVTSEEHVRVDVTLGEQTYTTHVTLFSAGCSKTIVYNTKLPKKFCNFTPGRIPDTTAPTVLSTIPANGATGVAINIKITATFREAMNPETINVATFTVMQGATPVSGNVTYAVNSNTAVFAFTPAANLASNSVYTATITTGAEDLARNPLAASVIWSFTTSATADTTPPNVISTNPADMAVNVPINRTVSATFDKAMDPATINSANFTLTGPGAGPGISAKMITYDSTSKIATFIPQSDFAPGTQFTATIKTGVQDLAGNALAANKVWTFTTGTQPGIVPPPLGAAAAFGSFGGGAGMTNQGLFTVVNGDISTTGASTTVTGFHDSTGDIYTETPLNKGQVNGRIYTAPPTPGGAGVGGNASTFAVATQGATDAQTAY